MAEAKTKSEATTYFERKKGYFYEWPTIEYKLDILNRDGVLLSENEKYEIVNFIHRFHFKDKIINNISMFSYWKIRSHETIFSISDRLYKSTYYFWIIILLNNMIDPLYSWPLTDEQLLQFCINKYGREGLKKLHHYESVKSNDLYANRGITIAQSTPIDENISTGLKNKLKIDHGIGERDPRSLSDIVPSFKQGYADSISGDLYAKRTGMMVSPPPMEKNMNPQLVKRLKEKYGSAPDDPRPLSELIPAYKENLVKPYQYSYKEVSNYEYEMNENENRKKIKLMKPQYLQDVLKEKDEIIKANFIRTNRSLVRMK